MFYDQITDFIFQEDQPQKCRFIFIPGSGYGELAVRAAQLYKEKLASKIIVSGKYSILKEKFEGAVSPESYRDLEFATESDFLKTVLMDHGVREEDIWQEKQATFTYENAIYIRCLLEEMGYREKNMPDKVLIVCQAFHGARSRMYFNCMFPNTECLICPVQTQGITRTNWFLQEVGIQTVLGEVERIGTQFAGILMGKDQAEANCRKQFLTRERSGTVRLEKTGSPHVSEIPE